VRRPTRRSSAALSRRGEINARRHRRQYDRAHQQGRRLDVARRPLPSPSNPAGQGRLILHRGRLHPSRSRGASRIRPGCGRALAMRSKATERHVQVDSATPGRQGNADALSRSRQRAGRPSSAADVLTIQQETSTTPPRWLLRSITFTKLKDQWRSTRRPSAIGPSSRAETRQGDALALMITPSGGRDDEGAQGAGLTSVIGGRRWRRPSAVRRRYRDVDGMYLISPAVTAGLSC